MPRHEFPLNLLVGYFSNILNNSACLCYFISE